MRISQPWADWPKGEWQLWDKPAQESAVFTASASDRLRPNRAALEPGRAPRERTFACAGRLGGRNCQNRGLPDATWLSGDT